MWKASSTATLSGSSSRIALWSRAGARCQRFGWSVSPARSPNRTCGFHRIRLSTGSAGGSGRRDHRGRILVPWRGDGRPAVAVAGHGHGSGVEQCDAIVLGPPAVVQWAAPQLLPAGAVVLAADPADDASPGVFLQVAECRLRDRVPEVVGPAAQHGVELAQ